MSEDEKIKGYNVIDAYGDFSPDAKDQAKAQQAFGASPKYLGMGAAKLAAFASALEIPHSYGSVVDVRKNPVNDHLEVQTTSGITINVPPTAQAVQAATHAAMEHDRRMASAKVPLFDSDGPQLTEPVSPATTRALSDFEYFMLKKKATEGTGLSPLERVSLCMEDIRRYATEEATNFQGKPHSMIIDLVSIDGNGKSHLTCYGCNLDNAQEIAYRTIFLDNAKDRWRGKA
jgi:hypothetical protein